MLVATGGRWSAYRQQDARSRVAGIAAPPTVERMIAAGSVQPVSGAPRRLVAAPAARIPEPRLCPADLRMRRRSRPLNETLLSLAYLQPGEAARFNAAAGRFRSDMHQAAGRQTGRAGAGAASRRIRALEQKIGPEMVRDLELLLIENVSLARFAIRRACLADEAEPRGLTCLHALAEAYALDIRAPV